MLCRVNRIMVISLQTSVIVMLEWWCDERLSFHEHKNSKKSSREVNEKNIVVYRKYREMRINKIILKNSL